MDDDTALRLECEALVAGGASAEDVFRHMKGLGCMNWHGQVMLMGLFDLPLAEARRLSHKVLGVHQANDDR